MDFKTNTFMCAYVILSTVLSCCTNFSLTKITDKKGIQFKVESCSENKKDTLVGTTQTTENTLTSISKEETDDLFPTKTFHKATSLISHTPIAEPVSNEDTTITPIVKASTNNTLPRENISCTCGIFLSSQFIKGSPQQPKNEPIISAILERKFVCNSLGQKQCQTKCLEKVVQHVPKSANILCSSLDHDIHKEKAYLFIRNCSFKWYNTNLTTGREYCCKNGLPYSCPKK